MSTLTETSAPFDLNAQIDRLGESALKWKRRAEDAEAMLRAIRDAFWEEGDGFAERVADLQSMAADAIKKAEA